jgi:hypothetical protein
MEVGSGKLDEINSMSKIESKTGIIRKSDVKVFNFLSDFTNFANFLPNGKIKSWSATHDSCSFKIDGIGQTGLKILEKTPNNLIKISSDGISPMTFLFWIHIASKGTDSCEVKISIEPKVNPIMLAMITSPLQDFADLLIKQMEKFRF